MNIHDMAMSYSHNWHLSLDEPVHCQVLKYWLLKTSCFCWNIFLELTAYYPFCLEGRGFFKRLWGRNLPFLWLHRLENWKSQDTIQGGACGHTTPRGWGRCRRWIFIVRGSPLLCMRHMASKLYLTPVAGCRNKCTYNSWGAHHYCRMM